MAELAARRNDLGREATGVGVRKEVLPDCCFLTPDP